MCVVTTRALLDWFRARARDLPWRSEPRDPYFVLVSEIMLQQTQVDRVVPRFTNFVEVFPTFEDLAAATQNEVLTAWSGLGYYRRARNLHRLARKVAEGAAGLPRTASDLERLPGIGPYTAAAVASLAFGEATPALDGNVIRVQTRRSRLHRLPSQRRLRGECGGTTRGLPPAASAKGCDRPAVGCGVLCRSRGGVAIAADRRGSDSSRSVATSSGGAGGSCRSCRRGEAPPPRCEKPLPYRWAGRAPPHHSSEDRRCSGAGRGRTFRSALRKLAMGGPAGSRGSDLVAASEARREIPVSRRASREEPPLTLFVRSPLPTRRHGNQTMSRMVPPPHLTLGGGMENPKSEIRNPKSEIPNS